jgi:YVTN family beta-propeller protein
MAVFSPDGARLWLTSELRGTVTVLDTKSLAVVGKIGFSIPGVDRALIQAVGLTLSGDGTRAYVALASANRIAEIDANTFQVLRYYLVGQRVWSVALSPNGSRLYTANGNSGDISVIDLGSQQVVRSVAVGRAPWGVIAVP